MLTPGTILRNHYKILYVLGSGGFGDTYLAVDLDLPDQPKRVVKHLKPNSDPRVLQIVRRLFDSEAQVLYRLGNDSDQIPKLFAHFEEQGEFYLVQEFVDGEDLSKEIIVGKKLTETEVTKLLQEILEVLAVVHKKNIIHRDIKPQNIMRRRQDSKIVLIDFGAVKEVNTMMLNTEGQTSVSVTIGTVGYMPSEQATGQPKLCSDVYAVGMLGIHALTGIQPHQLPKDSTDGEVIWRNGANVSEQLAMVLNKMVTYHFRDRYFSAEEVLQALQPPKPQRRQPPPPPIPTPTPTPTKIIFPNWSRRRVIQTVGFASAGLGLAIVVPRLWPSISGGSSKPSPVSSNSLKTFPFETVTVNAQGTITNRRQLEAKRFIEDLGNGVTLEMVQIPGGTFTMGSPDGEEKREKDESPPRQVTVPGFFMGKYEVTQAQYQAIMGTNPSNFKGEKKPVEKVSWDDAVEFCKKLSQKTGRTYRLPSEAEWEYACRAGTTTPFYFGATITTDLVNYNGTFTYASAPKGQYRNETTPVGTFPANAFGLYDMHGNVWEWCQDHYHDNYNGVPTNGKAWINDNDNQSARLLRGGSWNFDPGYCRGGNRGWNSPDARDDYFGFRVVLVLA
ncbi:bifunctional serine/threonine-protein kinase/formylglycine-generating enzyme family protein [Calothrix sp. PCC 7507]|uniref:bifunctional serine/threonine-protein kinase/formylglycine-generating enzyme family protein n=1 Tax=Calothrix sp. PCC 7507 TaxID=99598 RepID=UPI00029F23F6|nr:bifunctional serine/threonine-protein kinase/formylglycine-generating enzyme family protein [Calothrix sp. PCC 7507]AFY35994.1 serine/threonine protein kinase [Calothrix sp. PCC 7507]